MAFAKARFSSFDKKLLADLFGKKMQSKNGLEIRATFHFCAANFFQKMLDHQEVWIVPPARRVELFHSPRQGKLLVLCDTKPVVVSKEAFSDGKWDFFIDDALFQIALRRRGLEFFYSLRRDRAAATQENLALKRAEKASFWWPFLIFLAATLAAAIFLRR